MRKYWQILTLALVLMSVVLSAHPIVHAVSEPVTTISNPVEGQAADSNLTVTGTYTAETAVSSVKVIICTLNSKGSCGLYLQSTTTGEMATTWRAHSAVMSNPGGLSGDYSLPFTNIQLNNYRVLTFAIDEITSKGPRAQVNFSVITLSAPPPPNKSYITIMWGRSNWQTANTKNCIALPGARTLEENAQDMATYGLFGVGGVVTGRTHETDRTCYKGYTTQPSWLDLANLRDQYGWKFVSQGMTYSDMTLMTTDEERYQESGATLPIFESHGHNDAWGAFNYPNNKHDEAARAVVNKYFAFGRVYDSSVNNRSNVTTSPYFMKTLSVNGGRCNNPNLPCYNMTVANNRRTTPPSKVASILSPDPDQWGVVQWYRIVEGSYGSMGQYFAWDCTSPDWRDRWTSQPELTCRNNFLESLNGRSSKAEVTHPAAVAEAWERVPSSRQ